MTSATQTNYHRNYRGNTPQDWIIVNFHQTHSGDNFDEFSAIKSCWTCGGTWLYVFATEDLRAINGDPAVVCTGNTNECHHYGGECPNFDSDCNLNEECNCLHCYS